MNRVNITLDNETLQKARVKASELGLSLSAYIRMLINSN